MAQDVEYHEPTGVMKQVVEVTQLTPALKNGVSSLVYIERLGTGTMQIGSSLASTTEGSLTHSGISSRTKTKAISMHQTAGLGLVSVPSASLDKGKLAEFRDMLTKSGIDTSRWGCGGTKSVEHLFWETYQQRGCVIICAGVKGMMKRITRIVKIRLVAEISGVDHALFSRMQFMHDGQTMERKQVPLRKLKWKEMPPEQLQDEDASLYLEDSAMTEAWGTAWSTALEERLGLSRSWQDAHLVQDAEGYRFLVEENKPSEGYPGLNTTYCIHEVVLRVRDPEHMGVQVIGLPEGQEFATAEGDFSFAHHDDHGVAIGSQLNIWTWLREAVTNPVRQTKSPERDAAAANAAAAAVAAMGCQKLAGTMASMALGMAGLVRRVPLPHSSAQQLSIMQERIMTSRKRPPCGRLWACMEEAKTDWAQVKRIAERIAEPTYSLSEFHSDLRAFPELNLYLLEEGAASPASGKVDMSSGRTIGDEYQRTIGAFFAIYWMMRIDIDGKDGFTAGVDDTWAPIGLSDKEDARVLQAEKRLQFRSNAKWDFFHKLLLDSGLLVEKKKMMGGGETRCVVNERRLVSLLALTAFHDIMKMRLILPEVQPEHAPYHGYAAGDTIGDHDHALSYIMEHYPDMLPSFKGLTVAEKRSVQFTQCNLCFNHGWFVQAEAPPGAIFTKFRQALKSQIGQRDVALYFVHWLTDLAGAEPTPLAGCEKFVTKFPLPVLNSFLRSFEFVERIASESETKVMEEYLKMRWAEATPPVGDIPTGPGAIALMRLLCMAQSNALPVIRGFDHLMAEDREVLCLEMARTGCDGQFFSSHLVPKEVSTSHQGPAFLVYYGPAFLQNLGTDSAARRLAVLAEIYRSARELWPTDMAKADVCVTIRIDMIKSLGTADMQAACTGGDCWMLVKHNESEAFVEKGSKRKLNRMIASRQSFQVLDLGNLMNLPT